MCSLPAKDPVTTRGRVAVIGAGISGLSAAWLLARSRPVVLYEANARPGGHANTVTVETAGGPVAVDTGFIVYNDRNYPNLVALFNHLGVPTQASDMSFSASLEDGRFEYSGSGLAGLLGQSSNALRPRFWRMIAGILRFYREAPRLLADTALAQATLGDYLDRAGYSDSFVTDHLLPMGAAIWSTTAREMRDYPLGAFIRFFDRHGLLSLTDRPQWRTVFGGSRTYVNHLLADFDGEVRLSTAVKQIRRVDGNVHITDAGGHIDVFDDVVIAAHADHALGMLADPSQSERELLGAFAYTPNTAVLHRDAGLMPRRRRVWASWNYIDGGPDARALCVTYWMNRLQALDPADPIFVTLNPPREIDEGQQIARFHYSHPRFDLKALAAQSALGLLQGNRNTWFCGAYFGSGFHEDGIRSGIAAAEHLAGVPAPWHAGTQTADSVVSRVAAQ